MNLMPVFKSSHILTSLQTKSSSTRVQTNCSPLSLPRWFESFDISSFMLLRKISFTTSLLCLVIADYLREHKVVVILEKIHLVTLADPYAAFPLCSLRPQDVSDRLTQATSYPPRYCCYHPASLPSLALGVLINSCRLQLDSVLN